MAHDTTNAFRIPRRQSTTNPAKHLLAVDHRFAFVVKFDAVAFASKAIDTILKPFDSAFALGKKAGNDECMKRRLAVLHLAALPVAFLLCPCERVPNQICGDGGLLGLVGPHYPHDFEMQILHHVALLNRLRQ